MITKSIDELTDKQQEAFTEIKLRALKKSQALLKKTEHFHGYGLISYAIIFLVIGITIFLIEGTEGLPPPALVFFGLIVIAQAETNRRLNALVELIEYNFEKKSDLGLPCDDRS